jgi:hypothetical protein
MKVERMFIYKRYIFRYLYRQWVNDILGGFKTKKEVKEYLDIRERKINKL